MRTDPRNACANERQLFWWAVVHDLIAHPLMALSGFSKWSLRFHDWTSHKAWPRDKGLKVVKSFVLHDFAFTEALRKSLNRNGLATCTTKAPGQPYKIEVLK